MPITQSGSEPTEIIDTRADSKDDSIGATKSSGTAFASRGSAGPAALVTTAITTIALVLLQNNECSKSPREFGIHEHLIEWMGSSQHYVWQSRSYFVFLGLSALFVLFAPKLRQGLVDIYTKRKGHFLVVVIAVGAFIAKLVQNPAGMGFGLLCLPFLLLILKQSHRLPKPLATFLLSAFVFVMIVPGFFAVPDLSDQDAGKVIEIQTHYADLVGWGALLAAGKPLFVEVNPVYGFVQPLLIVLASKFGLSNFSFGTYVEFVRAFQAAFIVMAAYLFYRLSGRAKVASLFAIAFFAPFMQLNQMSEYFPNQTAWRLLNLPVAVLALVLCRSLSPLAMAYTFGALSSLFLVFNFETGLCCVAGFLAFFYMRDPHAGLKKIQGLAKVFAVFGVGLLSSMICLYVIAWLILGYAPDMMAYMDLLQTKQITVKSGYYGGGRLTFQPIPFLMVVHCLYTIVRIALDSRFPANFRNALRMSVSTMCLLWFIYFVNRPAPGDQYLIGCYFLYGIVLLDLVRAGIIGVKRKSFSIEPAVVTCALLSFIIVPRISQQLNTTAKITKTTISELLHGPIQSQAKIVSGVYLPADVAEASKSRADYIKERSKAGPTYYVTASSFIVPLESKVYSAAPINDLFDDYKLDSDTDKLIELLHERKVANVLVDAPNTVLSGNLYWTHCFEDFRRRLSKYYRPTVIEQGWQIWVPIADLEKPKA
ncbi:MAG: hypothetical protein JST89_16975 [Cyanobacteria bacterium SZAS-4]|nr:hypothetical protein [Cyanobacteria bacterium SZAS-4]